MRLLTSVFEMQQRVNDGQGPQLQNLRLAFYPAVIYIWRLTWRRLGRYAALLHHPNSHTNSHAAGHKLHRLYTEDIHSTHSAVFKHVKCADYNLCGCCSYVCIFRFALVAAPRLWIFTAQVLLGVWPVPALFFQPLYSFKEALHLFGVFCFGLFLQVKGLDEFI